MSEFVLVLPTKQSSAVAVLLAILALSGCATRVWESQSLDVADFRARKATEIRETVRVSAAVPDAEETSTIFGLPLYDSGIQPVWLEVENTGDAPVRLALASVDSEYYSPLEVAYKHRKGFSKEARAAMESWYHRQGMVRQIPSGETRSGFVFTHLAPGTKGFNVDIFANDRDFNFTFFLSVPGFKPDHAEVDFEGLYRPDDLQVLDRDGLREALSALPCCSTDESSEKSGDPFNVVVVGKGVAIARALLRAGWHETAAGSVETVAAKSHHYRGRPPDATFHQYRSDGSERKALRFWLSPMSVDGESVWLAQASNDIRRTKDDDRIVYYRVDPDLDAARLYLMQNLWYSQSLAQVGFTTGGVPVTIDAPRESLNDVVYFTDGLRAVFWVSERPVGLDETILLEWESPGIN